jgi:hypothetical protein
VFPIIQGIVEFLPGHIPGGFLMFHPAIFMRDAIALQVLVGTHDEGHVLPHPFITKGADHIEREGFFMSHGVSLKEKPSH